MEHSPEVWHIPPGTPCIFKMYISTAFVFNVSLVPLLWIHNYLIILWLYDRTFHIFVIILITQRFISADYHYRSRSHITLYHVNLKKKNT